MVLSITQYGELLKEFRRIEVIIFIRLLLVQDTSPWGPLMEGRGDRMLRHDSFRDMKMAVT